jgi:predicted lipid-binding transport protein (Tim44 family)
MTEVLSTNGLPVAGAALSTAIAPVTRTAIADDILLGFLAFLGLLLALALIAIVTFEPPERTSIAEEPAQAASPALAPANWAIAVPTPQSGQRRVAPATQSGRHHVAAASQSRLRPVAPPPLPVRVPGQQPGYAARHAPGAGPNQGTPERPRVSGGPPWGPAPRPPGHDPFLRSSD